MQLDVAPGSELIEMKPKFLWVVVEVDQTQQKRNHAQRWAQIAIDYPKIDETKELT